MSGRDKEREREREKEREREREREGGREREDYHLFQRYYKLSECSCCACISTLLIDNKHSLTFEYKSDDRYNVDK